MRYVRNLLSNFWKNQTGITTVEISFLFSAAVILSAVLIVPVLNKTTDTIVASNGLGIDPVTTASTSESEKPAKRYMKRKSVLEQQEATFCFEGKWTRCD